MKVSNTVVSAIVIVAILVSAYGLGLLIRQARTGRTHVQAPADVNNTARQTEIMARGPGDGRRKDTPEERAKIKDQRTQALEKMKAMTPEERQKFREQIRQQVSGRQPGKGPKDFSSVPQAKKAPGSGQTEADPQSQDVNAPAPEAGANPKPGVEKAGAASGKAGSG
jgi:hypothetical protein